MKNLPLWFILLGLVLVFAGVQPGGAQPAEWSLTVTRDGAPVHVKPDAASAVAANLSKGTVLKSGAREGEWFRVVVQAGREGALVIGYLSAADVEVTQKPAQAPDLWEVPSTEYRGSGISVRIGGGYLFFSGADIRSGTAGMFEQGAAVISSLGDTVEEKKQLAFHAGYSLTADITYSLSRKLGVGLRLDYMAAAPESFIRFTPTSGVSYEMWSLPDMSVIALRPGIYYDHPLNRRLTFLLNGGPVVYFTSYSYNFQLPRLDAEHDIQQNLKATTLGVQGGAGLEFGLNDRTAIFLEVQGRYGRIANLKGEEQTYTLVNKQSVGTTVNGYLYYEDSGVYPSLSVLENEPAGAIIHRAVLDLSGISVSGGFRLKF